MSWSAENATGAFLQSVKMGKKVMEPDMTEFISALAAGSSAQLMVEACGGIAGATTLALVAAAHQTGGRVVCILQGLDELESSKQAIGKEVNYVEFIIGDAQMLLLNDYMGADFVLIDCNMVEHQKVFAAAQMGANSHGAMIMGYNAFHKGACWSGSRTDLLPIGDGLQVMRIQGCGKASSPRTRKSRWVVRVDQCTGEEHVFRITSPHRKELEA
ncbi:Protein of unknown function DUF1442 [Cinnamomum micranthum f. kanehirae]|uniref:S-adenosyl-L-methionine-dependent methyltransferase n=1 Tax=Cinnamomum micranthum f. kanehirae TaxID=337451 RepID=A0A3S3QMI3_9MAGN|nr:Protein of unknown function DUF1442 [Cinnamomum micranthum f. kanehirae]